VVSIPKKLVNRMGTRHPRSIALLGFLSMLLIGCTDLLNGIDLSGDTESNAHAEYAPSHPWIGKCAKFELPMVYLTNLPPGFEQTEIIRIGRMLSRADEANYLHTLPDGKDLILAPVSPGTTFAVTAVFTIVHKGFSRMFADDVEVAVLKDNHGQVSTEALSSLKPCN
jgi:hypothetical protein